MRTVFAYLAACWGLRRRQRAMTTRPEPSSNAATPMIHSSESSAPVKAMDGLVLAEVVGEVAAALVATGVVPADVAGLVGAWFTVMTPAT